MKAGYKYQFLYILEDGTRGHVKITSGIKCVDNATMIFREMIKDVKWFKIEHLGYAHN